MVVLVLLGALGLAVGIPGSSRRRPRRRPVAEGDHLVTLASMAGTPAWEVGPEPTPEEVLRRVRGRVEERRRTVQGGLAGVGVGGVLAGVVLGSDGALVVGAVGLVATGAHRAIAAWIDRPPSARRTG